MGEKRLWLYELFGTVPKNKAPYVFLMHNLG